MSASLSRWLALREPADVAARSEPLTRRVIEAVKSSDVVSVLDLGTGTGSNLRFLAERLGGRQRWLVVDRDPLLLAQVLEHTAAWSAMHGYAMTAQANGCVVRGARLECRIETRQIDLGTLPDDLFAGRHLVTASALLDLVSEPWLRTLAARCRAGGAAALFTITYNGRSSCSPVEPDDDTIRVLMNQHQKRDKGLGGPAEGPDAVDAAERSFREAGYLVQREPADWALKSDGHTRQRPGKTASSRPAEPSPEARVAFLQQELQRQLIEGWAEAAVEVAPDLAARVARWKERRLAHVTAGRSHLTVGHDDLAAWLPRG